MSRDKSWGPILMVLEYQNKKTEHVTMGITWWIEFLWCFRKIKLVIKVLKGLEAERRERGSTKDSNKKFILFFGPKLWRCLLNGVSMKGVGINDGSSIKTLKLYKWMLETGVRRKISQIPMYSMINWQSWEVYVEEEFSMREKW